ncbi:MAG: rhodanese-like domain-containing protein [Deferribacteraceae bacterium]|nr:rhodanese-like domain-containing protein [Deferribacteraceae bacterium]
MINFKKLVLAISLLALIACKEKAVNTVTDLSIAETKTLISEQKTNADFVILDVRTDDEYRAGHIEGALNIDIYQSNFEELISKLDNTKTYLVYCRSGNRSRQAISVMTSAGIAKIYHMKDGFSRW